MPSLAPMWWIANGQKRQLMQDFQEIVRLLTMSKARSKNTPVCIACPWPPLTHDGHTAVEHHSSTVKCGAIDTPNVLRYCKVGLSHRMHANLKHVK